LTTWRATLRQTKKQRFIPGTIARKRRDFEMTEVKLRKGEPIEKALRKLKKNLDKEGTLKELRNRRYYEKPSEAKRRSRKRGGQR